MNMIKIAAKLGLVVVQDSAPTPCSVVPENYLARPSVNGFLTALLKIPQVDTRAHQLNDEERKDVRDFLRSASSPLAQDCVTVASSLPIFRTLPTLTSQAEWTSANDCRHGIAEQPCVSPINKLLDLRDESSRELPEDST